LLYIPTSYFKQNFKFHSAFNSILILLHVYTRSVHGEMLARQQTCVCHCFLDSWLVLSILPSRRRLNNIHCLSIGYVCASMAWYLQILTRTAHKPTAATPQSSNPAVYSHLQKERKKVKLVCCCEEIEAEEKKLNRHLQCALLWDDLHKAKCIFSHFKKVYPVVCLCSQYLQENVNFLKVWRRQDTEKWQFWHKCSSIHLSHRVG
jgi:hypothetical protein